MSIVSVSIPSTILNNLEGVMEKEGYGSRSEIIRESIRNYLDDYYLRKNLSGDLSGFVSVMYDVEDKSCSDRISELHHENDDLVKGALHHHFEEGSCFDIWIVEGSAEKLIGMIENLKAIKGTRHVGKVLVKK